MNERLRNSNNGCIERSGHSRACPARQQYFSFRCGGGNNLADHRTESSTRLNDRAFGTERPACSDRDGRRDGFQDCYFGFNPALRSEDRFHRFRNAVSLDFRRAVLGHESHENSADNGYGDDPGTEVIFSRTAKVKRPDVIEGEICKKSDQIVKKKCNNACNHADCGGQNRNKSQAKSGYRFHSYR